MEYADKAVDFDDMNFACHKWKGILISWSSEFEGYKRKIERSFEIRDHFVVSNYFFEPKPVYFIVPNHMFCDLLREQLNLIQQTQLVDIYLDNGKKLLYLKMGKKPRLC